MAANDDWYQDGEVVETGKENYRKVNVDRERGYFVFWSNSG